MSMRNFDIQKFSRAVCADKRTLEMFRYLVTNAYIRIVNYHNTLPSDLERIDTELESFSRHFSPVTLADMDEFFTTRKWPKEKPGLIPAIYEGYRNQYDLITPLLDKHKLTGWYFIPSFFVDVPPGQQLEYSKKNDLLIAEPDMYRDGRLVMNWKEIAEIAKRHEICCHTGSHYQIGPDTSDEDLQREIVEAKWRLEEQIGRNVDVFCWLWGEEYNNNIRAHKFFEEAGYKYVVSNLKIEKIK